MPQVIMPGQAYQRPGQIWDHTVVAAGSPPNATIPLFSQGIGGTGYGVTNKTKLDCNLQQGNRQNPGEAFVLTQLGFHFDPAMLLSDIFLILQNCYFQLEIQAAGAVFADGLLWMYPSGTGVSGVSTNNAESAWGIGIPNLMVARAWGTTDGFQFSDQQYFGVNIIFPGTPPTMTGRNFGGGSIGLNLWCFLDGLKTTLVHG